MGVENGWTGLENEWMGGMGDENGWIDVENEWMGLENDENGMDGDHASLLDDYSGLLCPRFC